MVRGRGYVKSIRDIEKLVLKTEGGTPVTVKDVATVALGPEMRRGIADYNGEGDVVGGIVVMRQGENALNVIERVKAKLDELKPSLPAGVEVVTTYDRSELIDRAIEHRQGQAGRGDDHRLAHHPALPLALPLVDRAHPHHPRRRSRWRSSPCT